MPQARVCLTSPVTMDSSVVLDTYLSTPRDKRQLLPPDTCSWVHVHYIEDDGSVWVMLKTDFPVMHAISYTLNSNSDSSRIRDLVVDQIVSALNIDDTWYRARVLSIESDVKVQFIDFGDTAILSAEKFCHLPVRLTNAQPLAFKVKLQNASIKAVVGSNLLVKPISNTDDAVIVDVLEREKDIVSLDASDPQPMKTDSVTEPCKLPDNVFQKEQTSSEEHTLKIEPSVLEGTSHQFVVPTACSAEPVSEDLSNESTQSQTESLTKQLNLIDLTTEPLPSKDDEFMLQSSEEDILCNIDGTQTCEDIFSSQSISSSLPVIVMTPVHSSNANELTGTTEKRSISPFSEIQGSTIEPDRARDPVLMPAVQESSANNLQSDQPENLEPKIAAVDKFEGANKGHSSVDKSKTLCDETSCSTPTEVIDASTAHLSKGSVSHAKTLSQNDTAESSSKSSFDPFISALGRYPHLGGGYSEVSPSTRDFYGGGGGGDNQYSRDTYQNKHFPHLQKSVHGPTPITKGRNSKNTRQPYVQVPVQHNNVSAPSKLNSKQPLPTNPSLNFSQDFKPILEFELSVIREQNRLQLLQLQKKMEQNMTSQIKAVKDEIAKALAAFRNEVNSQLAIINDSVVLKLADIYSDLTSLKNDNEISRLAVKSSSTVASDNCGQMFQYHNVQNSAHQITNPQSAENSETFQHQQNFREKNRANYSCKGNSLATVQETTRIVHHAKDKDSNALNVKNAPSNRLMSIRKEKMAERDKDFTSQFQAMPHPNDNNWGDEQAQFHVGHFNSQDYPKMDHFDPSKTGQENETHSNNNKSGPGNIICVNNLNSEKVNPDLLFNLFSLYGIVQRVKMSYQEKGKAYIEMGDAAQAAEATKFLNNIVLMGLPLHISTCPFDKLKITDYQSPSFKDFTKPRLVGRNRFKPGMWISHKYSPPSEKLVISNVLSSVSDEKVKEEFAKNGFNIQSISTQKGPTDEKKLFFISMGSLEEAVNALTVMHLKELSDWMPMRITFRKTDKRYADN